MTAPQFDGVLEAIFVAATRGEAMREVRTATAVAGRGLEGDRYFAGPGVTLKPPVDEREVTLIEAEALEALVRDHAMALAPGASRRNLVTRGVPLNHLVGVAFAVGEVVLVGQRLCEPCSRLARTTSSATMKALIHRGGLRARIATGGALRTGDRIRRHDA